MVEKVGYELADLPHSEKSKNHLQFKVCMDTNLIHSDEYCKSTNISAQENLANLARALFSLN